MDLERIIEEAKRGDEIALRCLYDAFYSKMRGVCIKILKEDREAADDIVHDAFILAFASLGRLRDSKKFGQWLTTIVKNVSFKYLEQCNKASMVSLSLVSDEELGVSIPEQAETLISLKELFALIDKLPEGYRRVFKLAVIEGFSHKEIAEMLGIEPHSSSSQLARAKAMLKKMLVKYWTLSLVVVVALFSIYKLYTNKNRRVGMEENVVAEEARTRDDKIVAESVAASDAVEPKTEKRVAQEQRGEEEVGETSFPDFAYYDIENLIIEDGDDVAESEGTVEADETVVDTLKVMRPVYSADMAISEKPKKRKWKMLLAGSLGPALAQNVYKLIVDDGDSDASDPSYITTWEGYYDYLLSRSHANMPADSLALLNIAKNNSGDIVERENHEKPITFGLSLTKTLNDRWSIETGVQYSLLRSSFTMGSGMNSIQKSQKIHYIGIPVKLSYRIVDYKRLSAYGSVGAAMNIPIKGRVKQELVTDTMSMHMSSWNVSPPVQWSVNASVGVQYELAPGLSLYLEPTLNYYIPTGSSTHTIWTEHPFSFTMPMGIRFTW